MTGGQMAPTTVLGQNDHHVSRGKDWKEGWISHQPE